MIQNVGYEGGERMRLKSMCAKLVVAMLVMSLLMSGFVSTPIMKAETNSMLTHFITRSGDKLMDGASEFRFIGANVPTLTMVEDGYWQVPTEWEQRYFWKKIFEYLTLPLHSFL